MKYKFIHSIPILDLYEIISESQKCRERYGPIAP